MFQLKRRVTSGKEQSITARWCERNDLILLCSRMHILKASLLHNTKEIGIRMTKLHLKEIPPTLVQGTIVHLFCNGGLWTIG